MSNIIATTTWNSMDLIERFLRHYKQIGFDKVMVMDFASTDGTPAVLSSDEWKDFVSIYPFPGIADLDSSNIFLEILQKEAAQGSLCLYCDPDELLVTPTMAIASDLAPHLPNISPGWIIPRYNVTASRADAVHNQDKMNASECLNYRIVSRTKRTNTVALIDSNELEPPWIYTRIPGKAFVDPQKATSIQAGDHTALCLDSELKEAPDGFHMLHYPFRSWDEFRKKIELAKIDFASNPALPPTYGWQLRRWIRMADAGLLYEEYLQQFCPEDEINDRLADGTLERTSL